MSTNSLLRSSQRITHRFLDIILPPHCAGCQRTGSVLCASCLATFTGETSQACTRCGTLLPPTGICPYCPTYRPALSGLRAVGCFDGPLRSCIHALKYEGNTRLAEPLGAVLAQAYIRWGLQADAIIPVPLHHEREQERGYNHAQLLAEVCAAHLHIPLRSDIVVRHRATTAQVGLNGQERRQNVAGAFECVPPFKTGLLRDRTLLLLDDVCTTGATLAACASPLFAAGAKTVWGLVLARPGPRRGDGLSSPARLPHAGEDKPSPPTRTRAGGDKVFYVAKISIRTPHFSAIIATKDSNARCQAEKLTACPKPGRGMQETLFPLLLNDAKCCLP